MVWNAGTKLVTEARGNARGYADPQHNPDKKIVTYVDPSGRGTRFDQLNKDHVAISVDHDGKQVHSQNGEDLRTLRGFTNPDPFSRKGIQAESKREGQDKLRDIAKTFEKLIPGQKKIRPNHDTIKNGRSNQK